MNWRTDKPTADVIVAYVWMSPAKEASNPCILRLAKKPYEHYYDDKCFEVPYGSIEKWADLEEDGGTICHQKDETVTNCHQLEEAARNSWFNYEFDCGALYSKCYKDGFKAGADWQREQDHDACYQCEKNYDNVFFRGEQHAIEMMKEEAIEGKCIDIGMAGVVIDTDYGCLFLPQNTFKIGDMVKVIILKDE